MKPVDYAVYKGDTFLCLGTAKECADFIGVKPESIHFMYSPSYRLRVMRRKNPHDALVVIRLDDDEE